MTVSPQEFPQVGRTFTGQYAILELLGELHELRIENRKLRRRVSALEAGRARWRDEARAWKWGALRWQRNVSA